MSPIHRGTSSMCRIPVHLVFDILIIYFRLLSIRSPLACLTSGALLKGFFLADGRGFRGNDPIQLIKPLVHRATEQRIRLSVRA